MDCPGASPCDRPLFRGIHVFLASLLEEEGFHVLGKEASCLRVHDVEAVMVDQHGLLLQPEAPAVRADLLHDARADRTGEGGTLESCARLAAPGTDHFFWHDTSWGRTV